VDIVVNITVMWRYK